MRALPISIVSLLLTGTALSQSLPEMDELSSRVSESLPSYWMVTDFRQIATSELGDAARPRTVVRFEADAVPTGPLYTQIDDQQPFSIVVTTQAEDETRTLYGVMDLSYAAGEWTGDVEIENPVDGMGRPADFFETPTLVIGDPETDEILEQLRAQREANAVARFEREMNTLRNEHEAALQELRQQNQTELANAERAHAEELAELRRAHEETLGYVDDQYEATLQSMARDHDAALAEMRAEHAERVAELEQEQRDLEEGGDLQALRDAHADTMAQLRLEHEAELEEMRVAHAEARGALREELNEEIAAAETELQLEVERLQAQLRRSEEAQELQEAFLASVQARSEAALELQQVMETAMARRTNLVELLPHYWQGGVRCHDTEGRVDEFVQLTLNFVQANPSGLRGGVGFDGSGPRDGSTATGTSSGRYRGAATLAINNPELTLPLDATLMLSGGTNFEQIPSRIDVTISETVIMEGVKMTTWNIDDTPTEITCRYELS